MQQETLASKYLFPFIVLVWTFISPTFYWILSIGFFIAMDLLLRILLCLRSGETVESSKMWKTSYKFFMASIFIIVAHVSQQLFVPDIPFMKIVGSYLIIHELKSIDEKAQEATGVSLFNLVISKLLPKKSEIRKKPNE